MTGKRWGLAIAGFGLIAAFFLFSEHRAHALGILPWLLLAACPLLHMFGHGGHGGHDHGASEGGEKPPSRPGERPPHSRDITDKTQGTRHAGHE